MALAILSKKLGINERFKSFAELQSHLKLSLESMSLLVKENIENKDMSVCEVEKITERKIEEILDDIP